MKAFHTYITRKDDFTFCYYDKDHLGNVRQVTELDGTSKGDVIQKNNYYPFGAEFCDNWAKSYIQRHKYNGKEFDNMHGLNTYDYGARQYNPVTARWDRIDPLAEKHYHISPYLYCGGDPVNRLDLDGRDDYRFDSKTGIFTLMEKTDDQTDRICVYHYDRKTDSYKKNSNVFSSKILLDNIEKGILSDGLNLKKEDLLVPVGGENEASVRGVMEFALGFSELINKELSGYGFSADGSGVISDMIIGNYKNNTYTSSSCSVKKLVTKYGNDCSMENLYLDFHTHPDGKLGATEAIPQQSKDVQRKNAMKQTVPNATFIVLYRPYSNMEEYDYTDN